MFVMFCAQRGLAKRCEGEVITVDNEANPAEASTKHDFGWRNPKTTEH